MTALLIRILILGVIVAAVSFGIRRIWRDWTSAFRADHGARRKRDLQERKRPDVIELKRNKDGVYRPGGNDEP